MGIEESFEQWRSGTFGDDDAVRISGASVNALRQAATMGAIKPSTGEGRNRKRQWSREALTQSVIGTTLNSVGVQLPIAYRVAFHYKRTRNKNNYDPCLRFGYFPLDHRNPGSAEMRSNGEYAVRAWLTDEFSAPLLDEEFDSKIHIINGQYVVFEAALSQVFRKHNLPTDSIEELTTTFAGRITNDARGFVSWERPWEAKSKLSPKHIAERDARLKAGEDVHAVQQAYREHEVYDVEHQFGSLIDATFLDLKFERTEEIKAKHVAAAKRAMLSPLSIVTVNPTMAFRMATRRALGLRCVD